MDAKDFPVDIDDDDDVSTNRYAFLMAKSNDSDVIIDKSAKVLVSFLDGVVLLQTDKPIYTPRQSGSLEYTKGKVSLYADQSNFLFTDRIRLISLEEDKSTYLSFDKSTRVQQYLTHPCLWTPKATEPALKSVLSRGFQDFVSQDSVVPK